MYHKVRKYSEYIFRLLKAEGRGLQFVSAAVPLKWHPVHVTRFFETLFLTSYWKNYEEFDAQYSFLFNSYYESAWIRWMRSHCGDLGGPTVKEICECRKFIVSYKVLRRVSVANPEGQNRKIFRKFFNPYERG